SASPTGKTHTDLDAYYAALDAFYAERDKVLPRTEAQKTLLTLARAAARDPKTWEHVRKYNDASRGAKLSWLSAPIEAKNDASIKFDAVLQDRMVRAHVFLVAAGLMKEKVFSVGPSGGLRE